ncbi:MAG: glycosyltransferase family A protein [Isosphaeraceae bacterium]
MPSAADRSNLSVVIIGRNEGDRLRRALDSVADCGSLIVYVDSQSTDGSVPLARSMGAVVVELEPTQRPSAARARNLGFEKAREIAPQLEAVQFLDGDCELAGDWLDRAAEVLETRPEVAVVCGRLRERFPERSVYNRLADLEWNLPTGEVSACGGVAMIRARAFQAAGGFDPTIIAAEDDELCLRIRSGGWKVLRLDEVMGTHDMAMTRFRQWWRRSVRTGHAYAEGSSLHGRSPERHFVRQTRSTIFWGLVLPVLALGLAWPTRGLSLLLAGGYLVLYLKTRRYYERQRAWPRGDASLYAAWIVLAKFPQAVGLVRYWAGRFLGKRSDVIEHRVGSDRTQSIG